MKAANISLLVLIALGPVGLAFINYPAAGIFLLSLIVVLLALNVKLDRIEEFALGPLKAKLREKIAEADHLSVQLKNAIKLTLAVAVSAAMRAGRFADKNQEFHRKILNSVDAIVREAGLNEKERTEVLSDFFWITDIDYRHVFLGHMVHSGTESRALAEKIQSTATSSNEAVFAVKELARLYGATSPELYEWITDYEYFSSNKTLRRPDVWFQHEHDANGAGLIRQGVEGKIVERP